MKNEFILAFNEVLEEKQLPKEIILQAIESAMVSAYRRAVNASSAQHVEAKINPDTGKVTIMAEKEVVETVEDTRTEVTLSEARQVNPEAELGEMVIVESTPRDFGRVAAQTARQVIQQRIRDAERQMQFDYFQKQLGEIVSGVVQAVNAQGLTIGMDMRAEGMMSRKDLINGERFRIHDRVRALIAEVKDNPRGPQIILSRTHRDFLRRLLENEVPEIYHGIVEIRSIAREPGERAKVAVSATQSGIDPVGACVGIRGVRIQAIVRELHDEKIDVIEWNPDAAVFIAKAISPARVVGVYLNERSANGKTATVVVPEDQLSLAIGRDGQNARLAAKLTGWRIDIKSLSEAAGDTLYRLQNEAELAEIAQTEQSILDDISASLAKKAEGRPLTPEEYDQMAAFVDRVEKRTLQARQPVKPAVEPAVLDEARASIPEEAFQQNLLDSGLAEHLVNLLQEAGYTTVGDLALELKVNPDNVLRMPGVGAKSIAQLNALMDSLTAAPAVEEQPAAPVVEMEAPAPVSAPIEAEIEGVVETVEEEAAAPEVEVTAPAAAEPEGEEEAEVSFNELFALKPAVEPAILEEEEEDDASGDKKDKKGSKKKKKKQVVISYDPDRDMTIVRKKHKRGDGDWSEWEA